MATRKRRLLHVDERTDGMTDEALRCRAGSHTWILMPQAHKRRIELWENGQVERVRLCSNGCGVRWIQIFAVDGDDWSIASSKHEYNDPSYKVPRGTGRLPKMAAFKAQFARDHPDLVKAA